MTIKSRRIISDDDEFSPVVSTTTGKGKAPRTPSTIRGVGSGGGGSSSQKKKKASSSSSKKKRKENRVVEIEDEDEKDMPEQPDEPDEEPVWRDFREDFYESE